MQFDLTPEKLTDLLTAAAEAHHKYQESVGIIDTNWQQWYANYILTKLISELWMTKDQPKSLEGLATSAFGMTGAQIIETLKTIENYPISEVPVDALPVMKMVLDAVLVIRQLAMDNLALQKQIKQLQDNYAVH